MSRALNTPPVVDSAPLIKTIHDMPSLIKIALWDAKANGLCEPEEIMAHLEPILARMAEPACVPALCAQSNWCAVPIARP